MSAADVRDALLKYMAQRGLRADPPVAHAEPIPEAETPDAAAPVVEGRFDKLWVDCDADGRTTSVLLREVREGAKWGCEMGCEVGCEVGCKVGCEVGRKVV